METLLASHRLLVGPRLNGDGQLPGVEIVKAQHTERQSSLWIRGTLPVLPGGWREEPLPLEELVIAYLSAPSARSLPEPELETAQP